MIQITPQMKILVALEPVDFRRGIDALAAICRQQLEADPLSGALFVFRSRGGSAIRILCYDGQGYWLCHKRLSAGRFRWWPKAGAAPAASHSAARQLLVHELQALLWNGDPGATKAAPLWRPLRLVS